MAEEITHDSHSLDPPTSDQAHIMGVALDLLSAQVLVERVFGDLDVRRGGWIATPNVDIMRQCVRDPEVNNMIASATLRIIDGAPVEWAGKLAGHSRIERVPGAAMPWVFAPEAADRKRTMLMVGGRAGAAERAAEALRQNSPGLSVGSSLPAVRLRESAEGVGCTPTCHRGSRGWHRIRRPRLPQTGASDPGTPTGLPARLVRRLRAAIDFAAGMVPRAPEWMQRAGLEWSYRVIVEPQRLAKRYFVHDLPFAVRMMGWALAHRQSLR